MSRYQSEAPKGQPTHVPAIKVNGLDNGSPEYQAVVDLYACSIRQFHASQQQQVSLSGQRQYKTSLRLPGATMTYQNNEGQELITLVVDTSPGAEEAPPEPPDEYWQWAIVETTIPDMTRTSAEMSAFMNPKPKNKIGVAEDQFDPVLDLVNPPLAYPSFDVDTWIEDFFGETDQISSLRVDLRPYPGGVKFDLYGYIHRYQDGTKPGSPSNPQRAMWRGADHVTASGGSFQTLGGSTDPFWFTASAISSRTFSDYLYKTSGTPSTSLSDVNTSFPGLSPLSTTSTIPAPYGATWSGDGPSYAGDSIIWTPGSGNCPDASTMDLSSLISAAGGLFTETTTMAPDGVSYSVRGIGAQTYTTSSGGVDTLLNGAGPSDPDGNWGISFFDYTIYHVAQHVPVPNYVYPTRSCPVAFAVFDGPVVDQFTGHDTGGSYSGRWESSKIYPKRWKFRTLPDKISLVSIDDPADTSIANHFGMVKLGTIIINPKKGKGGIKFTPA